MSKELIVLFTAWFLVFGFLIVGTAIGVPYHKEHFTPCWRCGKSVEKPNDYCTYCGVYLTPVCVNCGAEGTTAFCGSCGTPMKPEG